MAVSLLSGAAIHPARGVSQTSVVADDAQQHEMAMSAVERFGMAGLDLPPVILEFDGPNQAACGGAPARTSITAESNLIRLCWTDEFILLHELAHVWVSFNVRPAQHEPFMAMRNDVQLWASSQVPWEQRGCEHAANVIAWGLLEDPYPISRTYPNDPAALRSAFVLLTGTNPLHDGGPAIQEPDLGFFTADRSNPRLESGR